MTHRYRSGGILMLYQVACQRQMGLSDWQCLRPVYERHNWILFYSQCVSFIGDLSSAVVTCWGRKISVSRHKIVRKFVRWKSNCSVRTERTNVTNDFRASKRRTCGTASPLADIEPRSATIRTTAHTLHRVRQQQIRSAKRRREVTYIFFYRMFVLLLTRLW
jgi:hypothetical protein